jgi:hypothetical protein
MRSNGRAFQRSPAWSMEFLANRTAVADRQQAQF